MHHLLHDTLHALTHLMYYLQVHINLTQEMARVLNVQLVMNVPPTPQLLALLVHLALLVT